MAAYFSCGFHRAAILDLFKSYHSFTIQRKCYWSRCYSTVQLFRWFYCFFVLGVWCLQRLKQLSYSFSTRGQWPLHNFLFKSYMKSKLANLREIVDKIMCTHHIEMLEIFSAQKQHFSTIKRNNFRNNNLHELEFGGKVDIT